MTLTTLDDEHVGAAARIESPREHEAIGRGAAAQAKGFQPVQVEQPEPVVADGVPGGVQRQGVGAGVEQGEGAVIAAGSQIEHAGPRRRRDAQVDRFAVRVLEVIVKPFAGAGLEPEFVGFTGLRQGPLDDGVEGKRSGCADGFCLDEHVEGAQELEEPTQGFHG